jgi:phospholipid:diacylglycerol acyltransferase
VQCTDGDGTVPLVSLGLLCRKGWKTKRLNPAGIKVVSREYKHVALPVYKDLRRAPPPPPSLHPTYLHQCR